VGVPTVQGADSPGSTVPAIQFDVLILSAVGHAAQAGVAEVRPL